MTKRKKFSCLPTAPAAHPTTTFAISKGDFQTLPFILEMINPHSCPEQKDIQLALRSARNTKKKGEQPFFLYTISHGLLVFGGGADRQSCQNQKGPNCKRSLLEMTRECEHSPPLKHAPGTKQLDFLLHLMRAQRELEMGAKVKPSKNHSAEPSQCLCCLPGRLVTEA